LTRWLDDADWWVAEGRLDGVPRRWHVLPVLHPARNGADSGYLRTRRLLRDM
jgi:hypothetical protein